MLGQFEKRLRPWGSVALSAALVGLSIFSIDNHPSLIIITFVPVCFAFLASSCWDLEKRVESLEAELHRLREF